MQKNEANATEAQVYVTRKYGNNPLLLDKSFIKLLDLSRTISKSALFLTGNMGNFKNSALFAEFFGDTVRANLICERKAHFREVDLLLVTQKELQTAPASLVYAPHIDLQFLIKVSNLPSLKALVFVPWSEVELHEVSSIFPNLNWI